MMTRRVIYDFWPAKVGVTFDFLNGQMPSELTFERSTSGTFVNASGYVATAGVDSARIDYSPTSVGNALGLLLESSATNLMKRSEEMNTGPWANAGALKLSVSQTGSGSPANDSTSNVVTWVNGSFGGQCYLQQTVDVSGGVAYTWSVWLKSLGGNTVNVFSLARNAGNSVVGNYEVAVALGLGTPTATGTNTNYTGSPTQSLTQYPNGWWKLVVTATTPATAATVAFGFSNKDAVPGSGSNGFEAWGFQVEQLGFATSYVKSTASQGTRAADLCTLSGSAFAWYDPSACTLVAHGQRKTTGNFGRLISVNNGTADESLDLGAGNSGRFLVRKAAANTSEKTAATVAANTRFKIAAAYAANDAQLCVNGTLATAETSLVLPTVDRLMIGRQGGGSPVYLDGHVEYVRCFPSRESNARLQELTS